MISSILLAFGFYFFMIRPTLKQMKIDEEEKLEKVPPRSGYSKKVV